MAAYIVFTRESTTDPIELATYLQNAPAAREGHNARVLARYGHHEVLEGAPVEGVVILEFPTLDEAKAWYDSPAYRAVREHRLAGAEYRVVLVEGI